MASTRQQNPAHRSTSLEVMTSLFDPFRLRALTLPNRVVIPPMLMYRAGHDGCATDWHLTHYGRFALGGAGMVMVESTAIAPEGRVAYADLGLWDDVQVTGLRRVADLIRSLGSVPAIQLNHTGRKGGVRRPWDGYTPLDAEDAERGEPAWDVMGPSPVPYAEDARAPHEMRDGDIAGVIEQWVAAARRAAEAGFAVLEIHAAHGYLLHQFLSPISNLRTDGYGGSLQGRMSLALQVARAVRAAWPDDRPLFVRLSCVDAVEGGWTLDDSVILAHALKACGVDLIDCSSGGIAGSATNSRLPRGPGFQVPFAERIRRDVGIPTMAVGLITDARQAAAVVDSGCADLVAVGRQALVDPNWPSLARTALRPDEGFGGWQREFGWWLDKREASIAASAAATQ